MAHDVFVSYASGDKPVADAVCATLESHGIRCWMAPRDVLPGMHYGEAIIDAIHECRIMVLVFSSKANLSGHIPKEIERAVSQGATIMPLRIEDVTPAKSLDYFIGSVHWLDALTPPLEVHLQRLADNVQILLSRSGAKGEAGAGSANAPTVAARMPVPAPAPLHVARPAWPYFVIGGLTAIVLVLAFLTYRSRSQVQTGVPPAAASAAAIPMLTAAPVPAPDKPKKLLAPASAASATPAARPAAPPTATDSPVVPGAAARAASPRREVTLQYVDNSSVKLQQIIGDQDRERHTPTSTQTQTRFGIEGAELGSSFEHEGQAYFLFGPTLGRLARDPNTIAKSDTTNPESGVHLDFLMNGGDYIAVQPTDITLTLMDVPVAGISLDG